MPIKERADKKNEREEGRGYGMFLHLTGGEDLRQRRIKSFGAWVDSKALKKKKDHTGKRLPLGDRQKPLRFGKGTLISFLRKKWSAKKNFRNAQIQEEGKSQRRIPHSRPGLENHLVRRRRLEIFRQSRKGEKKEF